MLWIRKVDMNSVLAVYENAEIRKYARGYICKHKTSPLFSVFPYTRRPTALHPRGQ